MQLVEKYLETTINLVTSDDYDKEIPNASKELQPRPITIDLSDVKHWYKTSSLYADNPEGTQLVMGEGREFMITMPYEQFSKIKLNFEKQHGNVVIRN